MGEKRFVVVYDYDGGGDSRKLRLKRGQVVVTGAGEQQAITGWLYGWNEETPQDKGYFPENYVRSLENKHALSDVSGVKNRPQSQQRLVVALEDLPKDEAYHRLGVRAGQVLEVVSDKHAGWLYCKTLDGQESMGYVPVKKVKEKNKREIEEKGEPDTRWNAREKRLGKARMDSAVTFLSQGKKCPVQGCKTKIATESKFCDNCANFVVYRQKILANPCTAEQLEQGNIYSVTNPPTPERTPNEMEQGKQVQVTMLHLMVGQLG